MGVIRQQIEMTQQVVDFGNPISTRFMCDWTGIEFISYGDSSRGIDCLNLAKTFYENYLGIPISVRFTAVSYLDLLVARNAAKMWTEGMKKHGWKEVELESTHDLLIINNTHVAIMLTPHIYIESSLPYRMVMLGRVCALHAKVERGNLVILRLPQ